jgi:hypothetical protein
MNRVSRFEITTILLPASKEIEHIIGLPNLFNAGIPIMSK